MSGALAASPEDDDDDECSDDDDDDTVHVPARKRRSLPARVRRDSRGLHPTSPAPTRVTPALSSIGSSVPAAAGASIHPRNGHKSPEANTRESRQVFEHVRYAAMVATSCLATAHHAASASASASAAPPAIPAALPRYGAAAVLTPPVLLTNSVPAVTMSAALHPAPAASDPFVATLPKFFNGNSSGTSNGNGSASSSSSSSSNHSNHSSTESSPLCTPQQAQAPLGLSVQQPQPPVPPLGPALRSTDSPQVLPSPTLTVSSSPPVPFSIPQPRLSIHDLLSLTAVESSRSPIACKTAPADKD